MIKEFIPPVLLKPISRLFYGWSGNYSSWKIASGKSTGYDTEIIIKKVKKSLLKVKNGEAVYERDSVIFDKVYYSFPLLSALSLVALRNNTRLNVLDFGGSLGSSYYQNKNFFNDLEQFNWCVVEQEHFVKEGKSSFADQHLHFFYDVETCIKQHKINLLLLSSVIQYLEEPYLFIDNAIDKKFEYIMIDRTPLLFKGDDRITIQKVPKNIYEAKYPCWILSEQKLLTHILKYYDLVFDEKTDESINIKNAGFKAFLFKRKK